MNAKEFAAALLNTVADALPDDLPASDALMLEVDTLVEKFLEPTVPVMKIDEDKRIVYGWASVISKNGQQIEDRQGDVIDVDDLRSAIHDFMKHRTAGDMHGELGIGEVVESILLDASVQKSLGIDLGIEGWYVGVHIPNDAVWEKVKSGVYKAFSIGGSATREQVTSVDAAQFLVVKGQGHMKAMGDGTPDKKSGCKCGKSPCKCKKVAYAKFNPNHDAAGRFASGGGMRGAGRSSRSAGSKLTGSAGPAKKKPSGSAAKAPAKATPASAPLQTGSAVALRNSLLRSFGGSPRKNPMGPAASKYDDYQTLEAKMSGEQKRQAIKALSAKGSGWTKGEGGRTFKQGANEIHFESGGMTYIVGPKKAKRSTLPYYD